MFLVERAPSDQPFPCQFNLASCLAELVASFACADSNSFSYFDLVFDIRMRARAVMREMHASKGVGTKIV